MFLSKRNQRRIRKILWKYDLLLYNDNMPYDTYHVMIEDLISFERKYFRR